MDNKLKAFFFKVKCFMTSLRVKDEVKYSFSSKGFQRSKIFTEPKNSVKVKEKKYLNTANLSALKSA